MSRKGQASLVQKIKDQEGGRAGSQKHTARSQGGHVLTNHEEPGYWAGSSGQTQARDSPGAEPAYLVLGVEDNSLGVGHADHVVVKAGSGQPDPGRELVVEQGEL